MARLTTEQIKQFANTTFGREVGKYISRQVIAELLFYRQLSEEIGCPLEDLIAITDNTKSIIIDENKIGETFEKEQWKRVKSFIPDSFNRTYIFCGVWYEENFKGNSDRLVIPIKQYKKTWWLKEDRSE